MWLFNLIKRGKMVKETEKGPADKEFLEKFVDLSHYEECDFSKLDLKKMFVTKCTEGISFKDPSFEKFKKECQSRNIPFAAYHFFRCNKSPKTQAEFFLKNIGNAYPILDIETLDGNKFSSVESLIIPWLSAVEEATGKKPIIYSGYNFVKSCSFSEKMSQYKLWLAKYSESVPAAPAPWKDWSAWQYTDKGYVKGIGECDVNYLKGEPWI